MRVYCTYVYVYVLVLVLIGKFTVLYVQNRVYILYSVCTRLMYCMLSCGVCFYDLN